MYNNVDSFSSEESDPKKDKCVLWMHYILILYCLESILIKFLYKQ